MRSMAAAICIWIAWRVLEDSKGSRGPMLIAVALVQLLPWMLDLAYNPIRLDLSSTPAWIASVGGTPSRS